MSLHRSLELNLGVRLGTAWWARNQSRLVSPGATSGHHLELAEADMSREFTSAHTRCSATMSDKSNYRNCQ